MPPVAIRPLTFGRVSQGWHPVIGLDHFAFVVCNRVACGWASMGVFIPVCVGSTGGWNSFIQRHLAAETAIAVSVMALCW